MDNKYKRFMPILLAVGIVIGIAIGVFYSNIYSSNRLGVIKGSSNKINALLRIVNDSYVDTMNMEDMVEKTMPLILSELDPFVYPGQESGGSEF